ncbi:MAG: serine/threonine-protein kinase [Planctomycetota bacterium]|nr:serine/threonine-protein kinase [Planctomycetota bacterium]
MDTLERLGRYYIRRLLGEGAMGSVYLGEDPLLRRPVALKVPKFADGNVEARERFMREARCAAALRHNNLCPVFDVGSSQGHDYIAMAFIDGRPLSELIRERKRFPPPAAAWTVMQIANGMQYAHESGVIHRDLKPANVIIGHDGIPVVTDFGISRRVNEEDVRLTQADSMLGSPAYIPPEHILVDETLARGHVKSDIYSLGVMYYELLSGQLPFNGRSRHEVFDRILHAEVVPPSGICSDVDFDSEHICLRMMARDPSERFASMREVGDALSAIVSDEQVGRTISPEAGKIAFPTKAVPSPGEETNENSALETLIPEQFDRSPAETSLALQDGTNPAAVSSNRNSNWRNNRDDQPQRSLFVVALIGIVALVGVAFAAVGLLSVGESSDEALAVETHEAPQSPHRNSSHDAEEPIDRTAQFGKTSRVTTDTNLVNAANTSTRKAVTRLLEPAISQNSIDASKIELDGGAARNNAIQVPTSLDTPVAADKPEISGRWLITIDIRRYPDDPSADASTDAASHDDDVRQFEKMLAERASYRSLAKSVDQQATLANIRSAFEAISARTKPGDSVIVLFRGDVCDLPDDDGDEIGGMDEALVPFDGNPRNGGTMIRDDDLCKLCSHADRHVLLLLDVRERVFATSPSALLKKDAFLANEFSIGSSASKSFNAVISICNQPYSDPAAPNRLTRRLLGALESGRPIDFHGLMQLIAKAPHTRVNIFGDTLRSIRLSATDANHTD